MSAKKLEKHIDEVIDLIIEGYTYRDIAKKLDTNLAAVFKLLHKEEHLARANEARRTAAHTYAELAEESIKGISNKAQSGEITRQRELAHHYRWKASMVSPDRYGNKVDVTSKGKEIQRATIIIKQPDGQEDSH